MSSPSKAPIKIDNYLVVNLQDVTTQHFNTLKEVEGYINSCLDYNCTYEDDVSDLYEVYEVKRLVNMEVKTVKATKVELQ